MHRFTSLLLAVAFAAAAPAAEPDSSGSDAALKKMRDALRASMTQLQTAQAENATLTAEKTALDEKVKELTATVEKLTKQAAQDQADAQKRLSTLELRLTDKETAAKALTESLEKWKKAAQHQADLARKTEVKRAAEEIKATELQRKVADRERKNLELYKTGMEVLTRYKNFSYGGALRAREPFTGITKARLESLVQGYADQLADSKIKLEPDEKKKGDSAGKPTDKPAPATTEQAEVKKVSR